jgi:hypothetical protein
LFVAKKRKAVAIVARGMARMRTKKTAALSELLSTSKDILKAESRLRRERICEERPINQGTKDEHEEKRYSRKFGKRRLEEQLLQHFGERYGLRRGTRIDEFVGKPWRTK